MIEIVRSYFLSKPGTYDDEEKQIVLLNLASQNVCRVCSDHIEIKQMINDIESWQTIMFNNIHENELLAMIDESYELLISRLSEEERNEVFDLER